MSRNQSKEWSVYIVETMSGLLYTGIAKDVHRRFKEHQDSGGSKKGAKFFRVSKPKKLLHVESNMSHSAALKREAEIKKLCRSDKMRLIRSNAARSRRVTN